MYYKDFYSGLTEEEIEDKIRDEGFTPMKFSDNPGFVYTPHTHPETKLLAFLEGSMNVKVGDESFVCQKGDKLIITGNVKHSAMVGKEGCSFFWSEKLLR